MLRAFKTGNGRRPWNRGRLTEGAWVLALTRWAQEWLAVLQQTPLALSLAACPQSALSLWAWDRRRVLGEVGLYVSCYLVYVFSRGAVYDNVRDVGVANGARIAELQQGLGFLWEPQWQAWAVEHVRALVVFLNWAYILTYWPVILGLAIFLFLRNRRLYYYFRTVVLIDLIAALLAFALFPVASPFAIPGVGLVDTIQAYGPGFYGNELMSVFYNTTAAMPSLHFSWTVILGVYWWRSFPGGFKAAGLVYPVMTFFAITVTGNHFILDAIVGGVLAGLCFGIVETYQLATARIKVEELRAAWYSFSRRVRRWQMGKTASNRGA